MKRENKLMDNYFFIFSSFTFERSESSYLSLCHFYTQIQPQFCPFEYEKCQAHFHLPQNLPFSETTYKEPFPWLQRTSVTTAQALPQGPHSSEGLAFSTHTMATTEDKYGRMVLHVRAVVALG